MSPNSPRIHTIQGPCCQGILKNGNGKVHRIPPVRLKCMSEKRRKEMAALLGGKQGSRQTVLQSAGYDRSASIFRSDS